MATKNLPGAGPRLQRGRAPRPLPLWRENISPWSTASPSREREHFSVSGQAIHFDNKMVVEPLLLLLFLLLHHYFCSVGGGVVLLGAPVRARDGSNNDSNNQ